MSDQAPALPDLHVVTVSDRGYVPYVSAMLASLRHSLPPSRVVHVTVLSRDLKGSEICWPNQGSADSIRCFAPDIPVGSVLPIGEYDHLSVETYFRLFLESAFDDSVQRVIYLDADLVVVDDLGPLAEIELHGKTVAAVVDFYVRTWGGSRACVALKAEESAAARSYFNAGVLVIDLPAWRSKRVQERAIRFLHAHPGEISFWDQDALNAVLVDDWCEVSPRWNRTSNYWVYLKEKSLPFPPNIVDELVNPAVVHFASGRKPWLDWRHPDRGLFDRFVMMAGFGGHRMTMLRAAKVRIWKAMTRYTLQGAFRRIRRWLGVTAGVA